MRLVARPTVTLSCRLLMWQQRAARIIRKTRPTGSTSIGSPHFRVADTPLPQKDDSGPCGLLGDKTHRVRGGGRPLPPQLPGRPAATMLLHSALSQDRCSESTLFYLTKKTGRQLSRTTILVNILAVLDFLRLRGLSQRSGGISNRRRRNLEVVFK